MHVGLDQGKRQEEEAAGDEHVADGVERARPRIPRFPHGRECEREAGDADGHVDPEHGRPAELPDEQAAHDGPRAEAEPRHARPDPDGGGALLGGIGVDQDGEREGRHQRRAHALEPAADDQRHVAAREAAGGREDREDDEADQIEPLSAIAVAEGAAQDDQRGQGQDIGIDRPLEVARRHAEPALDGGQGDVHDGVVEQDHALPDAHRDEGQPASRVIERLGRLAPCQSPSPPGLGAAGPVAAGAATASAPKRSRSRSITT